MKAVQIESYGSSRSGRCFGARAPGANEALLGIEIATLNKGIAQHQKRPVALYAEGIKWLNWAVEMLEGKKTEFHGVQVKLPAKEGK